MPLTICASAVFAPTWFAASSSQMSTKPRRLLIAAQRWSRRDTAIPSPLVDHVLVFSALVTIAEANNSLTNKFQFVLLFMKSVTIVWNTGSVTSHGAELT